MSIKEDNRLLNSILSRANKQAAKAKMAGYGQASMPMACADEYGDDEEEDFTRGNVQWTSNDGKKFIPASQTAVKLPSGAYEIRHSQSVGIYFQNVDIKTEGLIRFPETNSEKVIDEIQKFWNNEARFREFNIPYKRGICLWGPPGSGKSSTIQFIMRDVIERKGIVIKFTSPDLFTGGMRLLREIEPYTPVVVLMEDIDSILEIYNESEVLNLLDGVDKVDKIVFLATTNYPEQLGERIINRPSRFDKRFFIGFPNASSRALYFTKLIGSEEKMAELGVDLKQWVDDTDEMSIAHLKELFVSVCIQGNEYEEAIDTLKSMSHKIRGDRDDQDTGNFGFGPMS
jgi:AAA+ superfamily predicted ATPase